MSELKPYVVRDAMASEGSAPRIIIERTQAAAISHVVGARFTASTASPLELLAMTAAGVKVEDPRGALASQTAPAAEPGLSDAARPLAPVEPVTDGQAS